MKNEKVESILKAARHMFIRHGIQKTSIEEIARFSRVAKATIYKYFGNKDQLLLEVLNREVAGLTARISESVEQMISPLEKLHAFIFTSFSQVRQSIDMLNLNAGPTHGLMHALGQFHRLMFNKQVAILQAILNEGVKNGLFRIGDLPTARSILHALHGIEVTWLLNRDNDEVEQDLQGLYELICAGVSKDLASV